MHQKQTFDTFHGPQLWLNSAQHIQDVVTIFTKWQVHFKSTGKRRKVAKIDDEIPVLKIKSTQRNPSPSAGNKNKKKQKARQYVLDKPV